MGQISLSTWPAALAFAKFRRGGASEIAENPVLRLPGAGAPEFAKSRDPGSAPGDLASALRRRPCSWGRSLRGVVGCLRAASDCQPPPPPPSSTTLSVQISVWVSPAMSGLAPSLVSPSLVAEPGESHQLPHGCHAALISCSTDGVLAVRWPTPLGRHPDWLRRGEGDPACSIDAAGAYPWAFGSRRSRAVAPQQNVFCARAGSSRHGHNWASGQPAQALGLVLVVRGQQACHSGLWHGAKAEALCRCACFGGSSPAFGTPQLLEASRPPRPFLDSIGGVHR